MQIHFSLSLSTESICFESCCSSQYSHDTSLKAMVAPASLTALPDLCLLRVLDYLPITELLSIISNVCHRFAALKSSACSRRQSLQLVINRRIDAEPANFFERNFFEHPCQEELDDGPPLRKLDEYLQYSIVSAQSERLKRSSN